MAKKSKKTHTPDLPGVVGKGVSHVKITAIDKAASKYEGKKEKRCQASPGEIAAKNELKELLHTHRDQLSVNAEGLKFYRFEGVDYILEETLKRRSADEGSDGEESGH